MKRYCLYRCMHQARAPHALVPCSWKLLAGPDSIMLFHLHHLLTTDLHLKTNGEVTRFTWVHVPLDSHAAGGWKNLVFGHTLSSINGGVCKSFFVSSFSRWTFCSITGAFWFDHLYLCVCRVWKAKDQLSWFLCAVPSEGGFLHGVRLDPQPVHGSRDVCRGQVVEKHERMGRSKWELILNWILIFKIVQC